MDKTDLIYYACKKQWPQSYVVDSFGIIGLYKSCGNPLLEVRMNKFGSVEKRKSYQQMINDIFNFVMSDLTLEEQNEICKKGSVEGDIFCRFWS